MDFCYWGVHRQTGDKYSCQKTQKESFCLNQNVPKHSQVLPWVPKQDRNGMTANDVSQFINTMMPV